MAQAEHFDSLVLGSGSGGNLLAWHLAQSGQRVAVVERRYIGGSCVNIACMPSKNEIWSARIAYLTRHSAQFGTISGPVTTDMVKVRQRKRDMVDREIAAHLAPFKSSGAELVLGNGRFTGPKELEVELNDGGVRRLNSDRIFIDVGSHAAIPDIPGLAKAQPLTLIEALDLDYARSHLVVLGAGYVGLELAQTYRRFGSRVTVIEASQQILNREDPDISEAMLHILSEEGLPMSAVFRREATDETQGFMKVLVAASDDRILGFSMIGADAGEVMATMQTAMLAKLPYPKLRDAIIAQLTTTEGLWLLLENVPPRGRLMARSGDRRELAAAGVPVG